MKKSRHLIAALALSLGMMCSMNLSVSARDYSLGITSPSVGSMKSTSLYEKTSSSTPYVKPNVNTISTNYFLSPSRVSSIAATDIVAINTTVKRDFTWRAGYGGIGGKYCLSAYPNVTGAYNAYTVSGTWSE